MVLFSAVLEVFLIIGLWFAAFISISFIIITVCSVICLIREFWMDL